MSVYEKAFVTLYKTYVVKGKKWKVKISALVKRKNGKGEVPDAVDFFKFLKEIEEEIEFNSFKDIAEYYAKQILNKYDNVCYVSVRVFVKNGSYNEVEYDECDEEE